MICTKRITWKAVFSFFSLCCACNVHAGVEYLTILAFGDSITQGLARDQDGFQYGILEPPRGARIDWWGYEINLEYMVEDAFGLGSSSIYNWGYHGLRSDEALQCDQDWDCIDDVLASRDADIILIMLGANDLYSGISHTTTQFNLGVMIDKSRANQVAPVLGTITPNTSGSPLFSPASINARYNPMIKDLGLEKGVPVADHYQQMIADWEMVYTSGDGLHLNAAGNYRLAETWFAALFPPPPPPSPPPIIPSSPVLHLLLNK